MALRLLRKEDESFLYKLLADEINQRYLYETNVIRNPIQFSNWLHQNMSGYWHDAFVVTTSDQPVGLVYSYEFNKTNGVCKLCVCVSPKYRGTGLGALAGIRFLNRLFSTYPLRKIYAEIYSHNLDSLSLARSTGMREEGHLIDICWLNGEYIDQYLFSITREKASDFARFGA